MVKHVALKGGFGVTAKNHRIDPVKTSKPFHRLISRLTTSWVVDHVKR